MIHPFIVCRLVVPTVSLVLLAACSDPIGDAKRRYDTVKHSSATADERCAAANAVPAAYLAEGDASGYRNALVHAEGECLGARLDEQSGYSRDLNGNLEMIEADNMSALPDNTQVTN